VARSVTRTRRAARGVDCQHRGIPGFAEFNERFLAWTEWVSNNRLHAQLQAPQGLASLARHPLVHSYLAWRLKWARLFRARDVVTGVRHTSRE
jgi:hypothetical protein